MRFFVYGINKRALRQSHAGLLHTIGGPVLFTTSFSYTHILIND